jgi:hypothetical protein
VSAVNDLFATEHRQFRISKSQLWAGLHAAHWSRPTLHYARYGGLNPLQVAREHPMQSDVFP